MIKIKDVLMEAGTAEQVNRGCLMAMIDENFCKILNKAGKKIVTDDILYVKDGAFGREMECHVTILFGFTPDLNRKQVMEIIGEQEPFNITLTGLSIFECKDFDVVKWDVSSDVLNALNEKSKTFPHKSDFPNYHAHLTIAYVQKGTFKHKKDGLNIQLPVNKICYSTAGMKDKMFFDLNEKSSINEEQNYKNFIEIQNEMDPDGKKHDLTLICVKCGNRQTCRCSKPKREVKGICCDCAGIDYRGNKSMIKLKRIIENEEDKFENFISIIERMGLEYHTPLESDKTFDWNGGRYPTISNPEGTVKVALDRTDIFDHEGNVWVGDSSRPLINARVIQAIVTDPNHRGQGAASDVLRKILKAADEAGIKLKLEPVPMKDFIKKGQKNLNQKQLIAWYKKHGFEPNQRGNIMTREPKV